MVLDQFCGHHMPLLLQCCSSHAPADDATEETGDDTDDQALSGHQHHQDHNNMTNFIKHTLCKDNAWDSLS